MTTRKPRGATRGESSNQHSYQERTEPVNTTDTTSRNVIEVTTAEFTALDWKRTPQGSILLVQCDEPGCVAFESPHILEWGDLLKHTAFVASKEDVSVEVIKISHCREVPLAEADWYVSGMLTDDIRRLTPERVAYFTANYNSAVALAAELNGEPI